MSESICRYVARDQARVIKGRHIEECCGGAHDGSLRDGDDCAGCSPCPSAHCRVCAKEHADRTCAVCAGATRDDLVRIATLCRALPAEVAVKGVDSEAMNLLSPAANPEAWGHITTSLKVGRLPAGYLACDRCDTPWPCERHADGDLHPLFVLATWEQVWRDALDHETEAIATITEAVRYLDAQLTYMAGYEHAPFEDFARDLRRCVAHLESVLHDGEQRDTGAPCMKCGKALTRLWGKTAAADGWECRSCHETSNEDQYRLAVKADYIERAEWLTDADMATRTTVKPGTVRRWASDGLIRKRRHGERTEYCVIDVQTRRDSLAA